MRISDWSSDVCSSDLRGWHSRASCAGLYWRYATERGIGASLAKRMCSEASSDASPVRAFLCPARTRPVDQPEHIGESGALRFARPARRQTRRTGRRACSRKARSEEHTSELQSLMRISYAVFCLKKKKQQSTIIHEQTN